MILIRSTAQEQDLLDLDRPGQSEICVCCEPECPVCIAKR